MSPFGRIITAMITPFLNDGSLDVEGARLLAQQLAESGSDGIVVGGTTGESPTLSHEEKLTLFRVVKEAVGGRAAVIAGTGSNNTAASEALTAEATALGVDGVMLVTPYYNKPSQDGLYRHFVTCAQATHLPVMLYNVPGRTGVNLLPETVARLAAVENIVALKDASGNLDQATETLRLVPSHFRLYSGDDSLTLPLMAVGAYGVVSVASHLVGKELQAMAGHLVEGRVAQAQAIHRRLFPLFKALFMATNPVPIKAALTLLGLPAGPPRPPLVTLGEAEQASLARVLKDLGLLS